MASSHLPIHHPPPTYHLGAMCPRLRRVLISLATAVHQTLDLYRWTC
jgi:hypothetical protein